MQGLALTDKKNKTKQNIIFVFIISSCSYFETKGIVSVVYGFITSSVKGYIYQDTHVRCLQGMLPEPINFHICRPCGCNSTIK